MLKPSLPNAAMHLSRNGYCDDDTDPEADNLVERARM
jgi:hypothetical protein